MAGGGKGANRAPPSRCRGSGLGAARHRGHIRSRIAPPRAALPPAIRRNRMSSAHTDPYAHFAAWFAEAQASEPNDPNAVVVATATPQGRPSSRVVLLKDWDTRGFV